MDGNIYIIDKIKQLKGSIFEDMPLQNIIPLIYIQNFINSEEGWSNDIRVNPILKFYSLYEENTIKFLCEDAVDNKCAYLLSSRLSIILDCLHNYLCGDLIAYERNKNKIEKEIIYQLELKDGVFSKVFWRSDKLRLLIQDCPKPFLGSWDSYFKAMEDLLKK